MVTSRSSAIFLDGAQMWMPAIATDRRPSMLAAHAGHREVVETLIAHRANLNITAKFGLSALMLAIVAGHAEVARLLAKAGADLSLRGTGAPGFAGKTAYDLAVERGMLELSAELKPNHKQSTAG